MKKIILTLAILLIGLFSFAAVHYIDPSGSDAASGDITHPYLTLNKAWANAVAGDTIYLRGGIYVINATQLLYGRHGTAGNLIKIWAYPGETPILTKGTSYSAGGYGSPRIIQLGRDGQQDGTAYIHFKGIEITGFTQESAVLWWALRADNVNNCIFENMNIHGNGAGMCVAHNSAGNLVLNCDFHDNKDPLGSGSPAIPWNSADGLQFPYIDGAAITGLPNIVRDCRAWNNSDDGFDAFSNDGYMIYDNCWAWHNGYREDEVTPATNGTGFKIGFTASTTEIKRIYKNCISFKNRERGFDSNNSRCGTYFYNCTTYNNLMRSYDFPIPSVAPTYEAPVICRNCITFSDGLIPIFNSIAVVDHDNFLKSGTLTTSNPNVTSADFISLTSTEMSGSRQSDGSLPVVTFLHLASSSDLINTGIDVGTSFVGAFPDLGAFEYDAPPPPIINHTPVINPQTFSVFENSSSGTVVGTVIATDADIAQTLTYSLSTMNPYFNINSSTGVITVAGNTLDYESIPTFTLTVIVTDNGSPSLSAQNTITINLKDVYEPPIVVNNTPTMPSQSFRVKKSAATETVVGTIVAHDADKNQTLTFAIISGNSNNNLFRINSANRTIIVNNKGMTTYRNYPVFRLLVTVTDNGVGNLSSSATMTITTVR